MENSKHIEIKVDINEKDMFLFMLTHVYGKLSGLLTLIFSVICLVLVPISLAWNDTFMTIVLLFGALLYLVFSPLMLYLQSKKQVLSNQVFKETINYIIAEEGLTIKQNVNSAEFKWEDLYKIRETKVNLLFYLSKEQAFILPIRYLENKDIAENIKSVIIENNTNKNYKFLK